MAAEASAGQADGKPEVKHEDDEHFRTEDSSCRGAGKHRTYFTLRPRTRLRSRQALSAPEREMNETETTFCSNLSAVARERTGYPNFFLVLMASEAREERWGRGGEGKETPMGST